MSEHIQFRRKYDSFARQGRIQYGVFRQQRLTIPQLMSYFGESEEPIEAEVEAHWYDERRPDKVAFCGATYTFTPKTGLIAAQSTTSIEESTFGYGVIVHPNTTIRNSSIGCQTEISNTSTVISSRVGHGCLIGSNVVIEGSKVLDHSQIEAGMTYHPAHSLEATGRDFKELAYEGAHW
jgi:NDP-sugar pyrophosphorylase family protein